MRLLLDTHIWLWLIGDSQRLGKHVLQELKSGNNEIWLSPMSVWEALTLHRKRRIWLSEDLAGWLARATIGTREAVLTHEIMLVGRQLQLHKDPSDRILAATALVHDLTLVTADGRLLGLGNLRTFANR